MNKDQFTSLLKQHLFSELFISQMGWNNPVSKNSLSLEIDEVTYTFQPVAQRSGFGIFSCEVDSIPSASTIRKIDSRFRRASHDYICIYYQKTGESQVWAAPVNTTEKREVIVIEYETNENSIQFLFEKIASLSFELTEQTTISMVRERIAGEFKVNGENLTKEFYRGFRQEHKAFVEFITGMDDSIATQKNLNKQWYASVMLNRLMFCYFIQKKGFLNHDEHYLRNKLQQVQETEGNNKFYSSFYRSFLLQLFHGGLNEPHRAADFEHRYGRIPYLNGGLFDVHQLEKDYADIDIADEAFVRLFGFFDKWRWHLDTRMTASGRDINPDVLGYIFEQYINDRAQMGAYYTKEDITEYIGKNCIIPFLMDRLQEKSPDAFKPDGYVWQTLRNSGDAYIYDAVKKGLNHWDEIPEEIAKGIDTNQPDLLERRAHWNDRTPEQWALPTEIWRESIERMQRCRDIQSKISKREITHINDFITYNLDIRQFVQDLLEHTDDHLFIRHFNEALLNVTILDPTCGSGAFLFAAMNILEPLYEICVERMQEFNEQNPNLFKQELEELRSKYRSNIQYFIYKTIILHNLYGVDIMHEATEIAKLRLFLKMVAVVDVDMRADNLGLDPLPDIDFNIRCGNTLVGYATEQKLNEDLSFAKDLIEELANQELKKDIQDEMEKVAMTFKRFQQLQMTQDATSMQAFKEAKKDLNWRLKALNDLLNQKMYASITDGNIPYEDWLASHQPFHWLAEYYNIIHGNGGFDVIIGNPPYVEYNKKVEGVAISDIYKLHGYNTLECGNLYAYVMERSKYILSHLGYIGMIVPLSGHSTERMKSLVKEFYEKFSYHTHLNLSADANPSRLFDGVKFRLCIFIVTNTGEGRYSSKYTRWFAEERKLLFQSFVKYNNIENYTYQVIIPKVSNPLFIRIAQKILSEKCFFKNVGSEKCLYHNAPVNWIRSHSFVPYFKSERDGEGVTKQLNPLLFDDISQVKVGSSILNSSLFFIWWITNSDCYHLNKPEITNFGFTYKEKEAYEICKEADILAADMQAKSQRRVYNYKTSGRVEYDEFYMKLSKPIIDEIDKVLARHYGFTEEELDFIINYDIKYRMGDELNDE